MREVDLEEAQAGSRLNVDASEVGREPILVRRRGEAVAALVPISEYEAFTAWREANGGEQSRQANEAAFWREREAYIQSEETLRRQYNGLYVAFRGGKLVDADADESALIMRLYERFGSVPVYVRRVGAPLPEVHLRSPRLVHP